MQFSMEVLNAAGIIAVILVMVIIYQLWLIVKDRYDIKVQSNLVSAGLLVANYIVSFIIVFALIGIANRI